MIKGVFKLVFGIIGAVIVTGLIILVTFVIGHAVTGTWDITKWGKSENEAAAIVTEYNYEQDTLSFDDCTLCIES